MTSYLFRCKYKILLCKFLKKYFKAFYTIQLVFCSHLQSYLKQKRFSNIAKSPFFIIACSLLSIFPKEKSIYGINHLSFRCIVFHKTLSKKGTSSCMVRVYRDIKTCHIPVIRKERVKTRLNSSFLQTAWVL